MFHKEVGESDIYLQNAFKSISHEEITASRVVTASNLTEVLSRSLTVVTLPRNLAVARSKSRIILFAVIGG